jgi:hypothetical protein
MKSYTKETQMPAPRTVLDERLSEAGAEPTDSAATPGTAVWM